LYDATGSNVSNMQLKEFLSGDGVHKLTLQFDTAITVQLSHNGITVAHSVAARKLGSPCSVLVLPFVRQYNAAHPEAPLDPTGVAIYRVMPSGVNKDMMEIPLGAELDNVALQLAKLGEVELVEAAPEDIIKVSMSYTDPEGRKLALQHTVNHVQTRERKVDVLLDVFVSRFNWKQWDVPLAADLKASNFAVMLEGQNATLSALVDLDNGVHLEVVPLHHFEASVILSYNGVESRHWVRKDKEEIPCSTLIKHFIKAYNDDDKARTPLVGASNYNLYDATGSNVSNMQLKEFVSGDGVHKLTLQFDTAITVRLSHKGCIIDLHVAARKLGSPCSVLVLPFVRQYNAAHPEAPLDPTRMIVHLHGAIMTELSMQQLIDMKEQMGPLEFELATRLPTKFMLSDEPKLKGLETSGGIQFDFANKTEKFTFGDDDVTKTIFKELEGEYVVATYSFNKIASTPDNLKLAAAINTNQLIKLFDTTLAYDKSELEALYAPKRKRNPAAGGIFSCSGR